MIDKVLMTTLAPSEVFVDEATGLEIVEDGTGDSVKLNEPDAIVAVTVT